MTLTLFSAPDERSHAVVDVPFGTPLDVLDHGHVYPATAAAPQGWLHVHSGVADALGFVPVEAVEMVGCYGSAFDANASQATLAYGGYGAYGLYGGGLYGANWDPRWHRPGAGWHGAAGGFRRHGPAPPGQHPGALGGAVHAPGAPFHVTGRWPAQRPTGGGISTVHAPAGMPVPSGAVPMSSPMAGGGQAFAHAQPVLRPAGMPGGGSAAGAIRGAVTSRVR